MAKYVDKGDSSPLSSIAPMVAYLEEHFPIHIRHNESKGRHVVAARDLDAGTLVMSSLCVAVIPNEHQCHNCVHREGTNVCMACKTVKYCGKECQAASWKQYHKVECKIITAYKARSPLQDFVAVSEFLLVLRCLGSLPRAVAEASKATSATEVPYYRHYKEDILAMYGMNGECPIDSMSGMLGLCITGTGLLKPEDAVVASQLVSAFTKNNFAVTDDLFTADGEAVSPAGALFNHACEANLVPSYSVHLFPKDTKQNTFVIQNFRTMKPVKAEEELCHSYVEIALPTQSRQARLMETYGFYCACTRCKESHAAPSAMDRQLCFLRSGEEFDSDCTETAAKYNQMLENILRDPASLPLSGFDELEAAKLLSLLGTSPFGRATKLAAKKIMTSADIEPCNYKPGSLLAQRGWGNEDAVMEINVLCTGLLVLNKYLPKYHMTRHTTCTAMMNRLLIIGDLLGLMATCEHMIQFYRFAYAGLAHPMLGLQLYTLASCYHWLLKLMTDRANPSTVDPPATAADFRRYIVKEISASMVDYALFLQTVLFPDAPEGAPKSWNLLVDAMRRAHAVKDRDPVAQVAIANGEIAYREACSIFSITWGPDHPKVAEVKSLLAEL